MHLHSFHYIKFGTPWQANFSARIQSRYLFITNKLKTLFQHNGNIGSPPVGNTYISPPPHPQKSTVPPRRLFHPPRYWVEPRGCDFRPSVRAAKPSGFRSHPTSASAFLFRVRPHPRVFRRKCGGSFADATASPPSAGNCGWLTHVRVIPARTHARPPPTSAEQKEKPRIVSNAGLH